MGLAEFEEATHQKYAQTNFHHVDDQQLLKEFITCFWVIEASDD